MPVRMSVGSILRGFWGGWVLDVCQDQGPGLMIVGSEKIRLYK